MNEPNPEVLIGIPTLNGPDRLRRCLALIKSHTPCELYKVSVLVSDDHSTPENLEASKRVCGSFGVQMLMADIQLGVAAQWNRLTRHTSAPIVILMNDDVEVVADWLEPIVFSIKNNPHVGMVGLPAYTGVNTDKFTPPPVKSYNVSVLERGWGMPSSTGFLFGFSRRKFDEIEGFDPQFLAFYEEIDFGLRMLEKGWPSYMLSYPVVIHQGGATTSDPNNLPDAQKTMSESRDKFKRKWGGMRLIRTLITEQAWPATKNWNTMLKTWID